MSHFRSLDSEGLPTGRGRKGLVRPDLNLRELCKEVGISHSHLSLVLLGRRNPSLKVARRLAEVLGISLDELDRLRAASVIISSNIPLRADGMPRAGVHRLDDPGIAVYFMLKKQEMCFACDKYALAWENMRAIQKTIEAIRGIERWGSSDMMQRAFRGFKAIPEKAGEYWREVLEIPPGAKATVDHVEKAVRSFAHIYHPDKGGTMEELQRLVTARENALRDLGVTR